MKNNKKIIITVIIALGVVLTIGTAAFAAKAAGRIFHRPNQTVSNKKDYIGEEKAKKIALEHAGLKESDVSRLTVKFDYDDRQAEYEVEFYVDWTEYTYDINAVTGEIISYDKDIDD